MKIYPHLGQYDPNTLIEIDLAAATATQLGHLSGFIQYVREHFPEQAGPIFRKLEQTLLGRPRFQETPAFAAQCVTEVSDQTGEPVIIQTAAQVFLYSLGDQERILSAQDKLELPAITSVRAFLELHIWQAQALEAVFSKEQALSIWKDFTDFRTRTKPAAFEATEITQMIGSPNQTTTSRPRNIFTNGFDYIDIDFEDGRVGKKIIKCRWCLALAENGHDKEYAYAVACHYDFEAARKANPNFYLTRKSTVIKGSPYCDFVWHDIRRTRITRHPNKLFWDNLGESIPVRIYNWITSLRLRYFPTNRK